MWRCVGADRGQQFVEALARLEREEDVRILFACESGSRAWGFPSTDSDYDVRFVYVRKRAEYLSPFAELRGDTIERPIVDGFDLGGWDLRKALRLFRKGNAPLFEWLGSPVVYREDAAGMAAWRALRPEYFQPAAAFKHYLGLARREAENVLPGGEIRLKKACYLLRAILALLWLEAGRGLVPTEVGPMVDAVLPNDFHDAVARLFAAKAAGDEQTRGMLDDGLLAFLRDAFARFEQIELAPDELPSPQAAEAFLESVLSAEGRAMVFPLRGASLAALPQAPPWLAERLILLVRQGSHAYGTARPGSDVDLRGVAFAPRAVYLGYGHTFEQFETTKPDDVVVYELRKLMRLGADCNPGIFEMLWVDDEDVVVLREAGRRLLENREAFLSQRARSTFAGYAKHQLRRLVNHRAWLRDPPAGPPTRLEFGLPERTVIPADQLAAAESAIRKQLERWQPQLPEMATDDRESILDSWSQILTEMHLGLDEQARAAGRRLGYDDNFLDLLDRERHFETKRKTWSQYQGWLRERNPQRAALEARFGYDTKHAMHLVRILRMGRELLEHGKVHVRRPDAAELLAIRDGALSFEQLMDYVQEEDRRLDALLATTRLPKEPDQARLQHLCQELIEASLRI